MAQKWFVQPFSLQLEDNDYHLTAFFSGHKEYRGLEVWIDEEKDGKILIRAEILCRKGERLCFVNDESLLECFPAGHLRPIRYLKEFTREKSPHLVIRFATFNEELLELDFYCTHKPWERSGRIWAGEAARNPWSRPLRFYLRSSYPAYGSCVKVNGVRYGIPTRQRLLFKKAISRYTAGRYTLQITPKKEYLELPEFPRNGKAGESWSFLEGESRRTCQIVEAQDEFLTVMEGKKLLKLLDRDDGLYLAQISIPLGMEGRHAKISFKPVLPLFGCTRVQTVESRMLVRFGIKRRGFHGRVDGIVKGDGSIEYRLFNSPRFQKPVEMDRFTVYPEGERVVIAAEPSRREPEMLTATEE